MSKRRASRLTSGAVFRKVYRDRDGKPRKTKTYYIKYYTAGKAVELSTGTENREEAIAILRSRQAAAAQLGEHGGHAERVKVGHLLDLLIESYKAKKRKSLYDTKLRIDRHLRPALGEMKAQALSSSVIRTYTKRRQTEEASAATINKELAFLRHAMHLGEREEPPLVVRVPYFEMLAVDNAREGTIVYEKYTVVRDLLPSHGRIAAVIAFHTGARLGEIATIQKDDIDFDASRIHRPGRTTKNGKARYLPIYGAMRAELEMAVAAMDPKCPYLLQENGVRIRSFNKAWKTACKGAGIPNALFHDLRRTALTMMIEAGLSEREAMEISGHKTRAVFDRYHIVSERRVQQLAAKMDAHLRGKREQEPPSEAPKVH